jgi:hypothetical protein
MRNRLYSPEFGLFTSIDPVFDSVYRTGGLNGYAYVSGNPYKYWDPAGMEAKDYSDFANDDFLSQQYGDPGSEALFAEVYNNPQYDFSQFQVNVDPTFSSGGASLDSNIELGNVLGSKVNVALTDNGNLNISMNIGKPIVFEYDSGSNLFKADVLAGHVSFSGAGIESLGVNVYGGKITVNNFHNEGFTVRGSVPLITVLDYNFGSKPAFEFGFDLNDFRAYSLAKKYRLGTTVQVEEQLNSMGLR